MGEYIVKKNIYGKKYRDKPIGNVQIDSRRYFQYDVKRNIDCQKDCADGNYQLPGSSV